MRCYSKLTFIVFFNLGLSQNIIDSYLVYHNNTIILRGDSLDGLFKPRDLDIPNDISRGNELWVINENSAYFDFTNGGSTVTYYNYGTNSQWSDYRKDAYSAHFMHTASAIAFSGNGGFANTLDTQDANGNPNGYFSGCTLWDSDTSTYARVNQSGPLLGSHWDMIHQSPYSAGIAGDGDNVYWLFDGYHNTIVKYDFNEPHLDHEHGGENHYDGVVMRYDEIQVQRVPELSSHMEIDQETGWLYVCDTGNQRVIRLNTLVQGYVTDSQSMSFNGSLHVQFFLGSDENPIMIEDHVEIDEGGMFTFWAMNGAEVELSYYGMSGNINRNFLIEADDTMFSDTIDAYVFNYTFD
mgnify:CR=1 FL=1